MGCYRLILFYLFYFNNNIDKFLVPNALKVKGSVCYVEGCLETRLSVYVTYFVPQRSVSKPITMNPSAIFKNV